MFSFSASLRIEFEQDSVGVLFSSSEVDLSVSIGLEDCSFGSVSIGEACFVCSLSLLLFAVFELEVVPSRPEKGVEEEF